MIDKSMCEPNRRRPLDPISMILLLLILLIVGTGEARAEI